MKVIDFKVPYSRSENCIVVNARDWVKADGGQLLTGDKVTNIQEVVGSGYTGTFTDFTVEKGDKVVLTKASANIAYLRPYEIPDVDGKFANVHWMQVIGKFVDNVVDKEHLQLFYSKVMLHKLTEEEAMARFGSDLVTGDFCKGLYTVLKVGAHGFNEDWEPAIICRPEECMLVTVDDSTTTKICLNGEDLYFTDMEFLVHHMNNMWEAFEDKIVLKPYEDEKSGSLLNSLVDLDYDDISEIYNRDKFIVTRAGSKWAEKYPEETIVCVGRDYLTCLNVMGCEAFYTRSDEYFKGIYKC